jgi:multicomponent Na+:H+ antiporter subunit E
MIFALVFASVVAGWVAITGSLTLLNLILGGFVGALALFILRDRVGTPISLGRLGKIAALSWRFIYELFASAVAVARLVVRPDLNRSLRPVIVAFPLSLTRDAEITLLANLITLTPGTLSVDVSRDRKHLLIHALNCSDPDALVRSIAAGFERQVREVFK